MPKFFAHQMLRTKVSAAEGLPLGPGQNRPVAPLVILGLLGLFFALPAVAQQAEITRSDGATVVGVGGNVILNARVTDISDARPFDAIELRGVYPPGFELDPDSFFFSPLNSGELVAGGRPGDSFFVIRFDGSFAAFDSVGARYEINAPSPCMVPFILEFEHSVRFEFFLDGQPVGPGASLARSWPISTPQRPEIVVTKSDGGISVEPGDLLRYSISGEIRGSRDVAGAAFIERVPLHTRFSAGDSSSGWSCPDGAAAGTVCSLPLGSFSCGSSLPGAVFSVDVDPVIPPDVTVITNFVELEESTNFPPATDTELTPLSSGGGGSPDLSLAKTTSLLSVEPGGIIQYELEVSNVGSAPAGASLLRDPLPSFLSYRPDLSSAGWSFNPVQASRTVPALEVGESAAFILAFEVDAGIDSSVQSISNRGIVDLAEDSNLSNNEASVAVTLDFSGRVPDIEISKSSSVPTVSPGGRVSWSITVRNVGTGDAADQSVVTDVLPATSSWVEASSSPVFTFGASEATASVGPLAAGAEIVLVVVTELDGTLPSGLSSIENRVSVQTPGDVNSGNDVAAESVGILLTGGDGVDVGVIKSADQSSAGPGDPITWTIQVRNDGNVDAAAETVVSDVLPENTFFDASSSSSAWSDEGGRLRARVGPLAAGEGT
ncbi:MAG: DUF11 domain-containing protein, partial [Acidobacteriota bacterium]